MELIELKVAGMTCGSCVSRVKQALLTVPGVHSAEVDLAQGIAKISVDDARASQPVAIQTLTAAGYPATPIGAVMGDKSQEPAKGGCGGGARTGGGCCCGH
jgi:copper chaperone